MTARPTRTFQQRGAPLVSSTRDPSHPRPVTFIVQRSTETMQQSVLWSAWCEKNQATLHPTPPVTFKVTA